MAKMVRFFDNISVTDTGIEINNIIGAIKFLHTGEVQQVTVRRVSGAATIMDIQVRYVSGNDNLDKLVYLYQSADISGGSFIDSQIEAPFSCSTKNVDGDLHLFLKSGAGTSCVVSLRVDFDIFNIKGI